MTQVEFNACSEPCLFLHLGFSGRLPPSRIPWLTTALPISIVGLFWHYITVLVPTHSASTPLGIQWNPLCQIQTPSKKKTILTIKIFLFGENPEDHAVIQRRLNRIISTVAVDTLVDDAIFEFLQCSRTTAFISIHRD